MSATAVSYKYRSAFESSIDQAKKPQARLATFLHDTSDDFFFDARDDPPPSSAGCQPS